MLLIHLIRVVAAVLRICGIRQGAGMAMKTVMADQTSTMQKIELADAHCHLDMFESNDAVSDALNFGVETMVTNGVDTMSNIKTLAIADGRHIFPALGIDPQHAVSMADDEIEFNLNMMRSNSGRIVSIGEVGLDYMISESPIQLARQHKVFEKMIGIALELGKPLSIHSRGAIGDVLDILKEKGVVMAHIHFFEGDEEQALRISDLGYMISVPPVRSGKRMKAIKVIRPDAIMAESDSPAASRTPRSVEDSIRIIADARGMDYEKAAALSTANTKRFFNIGSGIGIRKI